MRFGLKANSYLEHARIQRTVADWCAEWMGADARSKRSVEFGAGPGLFTQYLVEAGVSRLLATDISARMVAVGRQRLPSVEWRVIDAWEPQLDPVECIYSCSLLQWAENPLAVLKNWRRLLPQGGRILACLFVEGSMRELLEVEPALQAFPWQSAEQWRNCFEEAGFSMMRSETRHDRCLYPSAVEALRSLHSIGAVREKRYGAGSLRRVLKAIDQACSTEGSVTVSWNALRIEAEVC